MKTSIITFILLFMTTVYGKAQNNENIFTAKIGNAKIILLSEGQGNGNAGILIDAKPEIIAKYAPNNAFPIATNAFLMQMNGKNILFDTGYGRALFDNLQSVQIKPEDIDIIFITHMHGDHISGLLRDDKAAFPNATLFIAKPEHDYWTDDAAISQMPENRRGGFLSAKKVVETYKSRVQLFEPNTVNSQDIKDVYPGIKAIAAYGHTPGHTTFLLESGNSKMLIWGDLTHAMAVQMPHPEIAVSYDVDPKMAIQSRLAILKFVSEQKIPIAGMHIAYPGIGVVEKTEPGYKFIPEK